MKIECTPEELIKIVSVAGTTNTMQIKFDSNLNNLVNQLRSLEQCQN